MKIKKISYKIASWSFLLVGVGHTITDLTTPKTPEQIAFIFKMKSFTIQILGTETNIFSFHQGYSLMMGLLLFGYGLLNLMMANNNALHISQGILILNITVSLIAVILSLKYFFVVPVAFTSVALLGFTISFIANHKQAKKIQL